MVWGPTRIFLPDGGHGTGAPAPRSGNRTGREHPQAHIVDPRFLRTIKGQNLPVIILLGALMEPFIAGPGDRFPGRAGRCRSWPLSDGDSSRPWWRRCSRLPGGFPPFRSGFRKSWKWLFPGNPCPRGAIPALDQQALVAQLLQLLDLAAISSGLRRLRGIDRFSRRKPQYWQLFTQ